MNSAFYGVWKSGMMAGCTYTDTYGTPTAFPASDPTPTLQALFGDPKARIVRLQRRGKKRAAAPVATASKAGTTGRYAESATCPAGTHGSTWIWRFAGPPHAVGKIKGSGCVGAKPEERRE